LSVLSGDSAIDRPCRTFAKNAAIAITDHPLFIDGAGASITEPGTPRQETA